MHHPFMYTQTHMCLHTLTYSYIHSAHSLIQTRSHTHGCAYTHTYLQTHSSVCPHSHFSLLMASREQLPFVSNGKVWLHSSENCTLQLHRSNTPNPLPWLTSEGVDRTEVSTNKVEPSWAGARVVHTAVAEGKVGCTLQKNLSMARTARLHGKRGHHLKVASSVHF